ncbi:hypothetical protein CTEN210_05950 [Chaetoceros tenuissimus]|uniref:Uncharacterized protein n=1 Tax=Chaetoceros tenuissimus TaxID=426638 RepID=A0AAD3H4C9_9STRA|nr:hypothetical protein CTEN210_05950 [Chaetoceros tenuissimus]
MSSDDDIDYTKVFPANKIKAQVRKEEKIGRIFASAVDMVSAASAIFVKELAQASLDHDSKRAADDDDSHSNVITREKLEKVIRTKKEFSFLECVLDIKPSKESLSKYGKKRKAPSKPSSVKSKKSKGSVINQGLDMNSMLAKKGNVKNDKIVNDFKNDLNETGLNIDDLVKEDHVGEIIEDDEDYD